MTGTIVTTNFSMSAMPLSPEQTVLAFVAATNAEDWSAAAGYVDAADAIRWVEERRKNFLERVRQAPPDVEWYRRRFPDEPPAVADHYARQAAESHARRRNDHDEAFAGVFSEDELMALRADELVPRVLQAVDIRYRTMRAYEALGRSVPEELEALGYLMKERRIRIIGEVMEGPERAMVVYRELGETAEKEPWEGEPQVIEVRLSSAGTWGLVAGHELVMRENGSVIILG